MRMFLVFGMAAALAMSCKHRSGSRGSQLHDVQTNDVALQNLSALAARYTDPNAAGDMLNIIERSSKWDEVSIALGYFQVNPIEIGEGSSFAAKANRILTTGDGWVKAELLRTIGFNCGADICPFDAGFVNSAIAATPGDATLIDWVKFRISTPVVTFSNRPELASKLTIKHDNEYEKSLASSALILLAGLAETDPTKIGPRILELSNHEMGQLDAQAAKSVSPADSLDWLKRSLISSQAYAALEMAEDKKNVAVLLPSDWEKMINNYKKVWTLQESLAANPSVDATSSQALNEVCAGTSCGFAHDGKLSTFIAKGFASGVEKMDLARLDYRTANDDPALYFTRWRDAIRVLSCNDATSNLETSCSAQRSVSPSAAIGFVASRKRNYFEGATRLGKTSAAKLIPDAKRRFVDLMDTIRMAALMQGVGSGTNWKIDPLMAYSPVLGEVYASVLSPLLAALLASNERFDFEDLYLMHMFESIEGLRFVFQNPDIFPALDAVLYNRLKTQVTRDFPPNYYLTTAEGPSPIFALICRSMPESDLDDLKLPAKRLETYARIYYLMPIFSREAKGKTTDDAAMTNLTAHQKNLDNTVANFYGTCPSFELTDVRMTTISKTISDQLAVFKDAKPEQDPRFTNDQFLGLGNMDDIVNRRYMFRRF